eukprot:gene6986-7054_t
MISLFDLFKIGIGPSSSHTVGPMKAAKAFMDHLKADAQIRPAALRVTLFGSLAWTGKGHATDRAILLGLCGHEPATLEPAEAEADVERLARTHRLPFQAGVFLDFNPDEDLIFDFETIRDEHPNTMGFAALAADGRILREEIWLSVGGGFVVEHGAESDVFTDDVTLPFPFRDAAQLLEMGKAQGKTIAEIVLANELARRPAREVADYTDRLALVMANCVDRGLTTEGILPGKLNVRRRAKYLIDTLRADQLRNNRSANETMEFVSAYAIAVNEENAAGKQVVTAPTNGAAGVVPAVLRYYRDFCVGSNEAGVHAFLLTATAIGSLFKMNSSISGAEVGCQGEVGVACSMAAAGLVAALGGTNEEVENAAEIGMEHHLGMTCDPIGGLVQIPCIERNAFGAVKAINAASLAMRGKGEHRVTLDQVVATMRQTGADMLTKYKETSQGGLAVNWVEC